ncbi:sugar phosphate isomerase/epimerase [Sphingobium sp. OAS761]|uniref:sugar phosphate isomerase/epimerase family protein n=1 Tax=Sphingobium sp. OAS761 TaxID=2817901 RepID=UPI0020A1D26E|nr:sugar phosphate isomerase/epimerase [Sphingobium sp. OAS761]MCP1470372.1 sugar phosphate isomerase/epimerase [Sphingobium sp. OAS761]
MTRFCLDHLSFVELDAPGLIEVAAKAGFTAVSLFATPIPISKAGNLVSDRAARVAVQRALRDTGLTVGIIEPFMLEPQMNWPLIEGLAHLTAELGGTVNILGMDDDAPRMGESLGRLVDICRAAAAPMVIEAFPFSAIRTPAVALDLAQSLGPDVGLCVDSMHVIRGGGTWADVAALPPDRIRHVQLNDGPLVPPVDGRGEAVFDRLAPGEGEFDLAALLPRLPDHATIAVEAPKRWPDDVPILDRARLLYRAMDALFTDAATG